MYRILKTVECLECGFTHTWVENQFLTTLIKSMSYGETKVACSSWGGGGGGVWSGGVWTSPPNSSKSP